MAIRQRLWKDYRHFRWEPLGQSGRNAESLSLTPELEDSFARRIHPRAFR